MCLSFLFYNIFIFLNLIHGEFCPQVALWLCNTADDGSAAVETSAEYFDNLHPRPLSLFFRKEPALLNDRCSGH